MMREPSCVLYAVSAMKAFSSRMKGFVPRLLQLYVLLAVLLRNAVCRNRLCHEVTVVRSGRSLSVACRSISSVSGSRTTPYSFFAAAKLMYPAQTSR